MTNNDEFKLRGDKKFMFQGKSALKIRVVDWHESDETRIEETEHVDRNGRKYTKRKYDRNYTIRIFGITKKGTSVTVHVSGFEPCFYVSIPEHWIKNGKYREEFEDKIRNVLEKKRNDLLSIRLIRRMKFYGFTNKQQFPFWKIQFKSMGAMSAAFRALKTQNLMDYDWKESIYEANIPPFLRFIHEREIEPCSWISIPKGSYTVNKGEDKVSRTQIDISVNDYKKITGFECDEPAPMLVASFDIECDSSHGDFPLAKKNMKKTASEIYDMLTKQNEQYSFTQKVNFVTEALERAYYYDETIKIETLPKHLQDISKIYSIENLKPTKKLIKKVAQDVIVYMETPQTYHIVAEDIIRNIIFERCFENGYKKFKLKHRVLEIICESFADNDKTMKAEFNVRRMYTRGNKKPSQSALYASSHHLDKFIHHAIEKCISLLLDKTPDISNKKLENTIIEINQNYHHPALRKYMKQNVQYPKIYEYLDLCRNQMKELLEKYFPELDVTRDTRIEKLIKVFPVLEAREETIETNSKPWKKDESSSEEEDYVDKYNEKLFFPAVMGDPVIQIGTVVQRYGEREPCCKHMVTLKSCDPIPNTIVESYITEEEVIQAWAKFMEKLDPDIITGYNIFGFDFEYIWKRAEELNIVDCLKPLGRLKKKDSYLEEKKLSSSALGDNTLRYIKMLGRVQLDLLKVIQRDHNLVSYKLDYVAENFINDSISGLEKYNKKTKTQGLIIRGANTLIPGNYITIHYPNSDKNKTFREKKLKIKNIEITNTTSNEGIIVIETSKEITSEILMGSKDKPLKKIKWQLAKDDVSPKQIFEYQKLGPGPRNIVATYCIQDCALCLTIINKLDIITGNMGMANVCYVPLSFIFLRGQGIKIFSLVSKECKQNGLLLPVLKIEKELNKKKVSENGVLENEIKPNFTPDEEEMIDNEGGYEGAIVLKPNPGIYLEKSVTVLDYSSLYPSSMISENLSHDSYVTDPQYLGDEGKEKLHTMGYDVNDITYDVFEWINPAIKSKGKQKVGQKMCRFVSPLDGSKSTIPMILRKLLKARKDTRKKIKTEPDPFKKSVFDSLQLAYKMTANSLYGQLGATTSPICNIDVAASTTATGRNLLYIAKTKVEEKFEGAKIVYGDTDSIFIDFAPKDHNGKPLLNKEGLIRSIELGKQAEEYIQQFLKPPHKLEYEKTFWPFILISKKRYVGHLYEEDPDVYKQKSMGIVLKRRDNADIVKHVYGGIIDIIMNQRNIPRAIDFCKNECQSLLDGKINMDMLIITKSLRGYYKNPQQIAHKVLADRMGERDPGNKPKSNDRIPYVYIQHKVKKGQPILQGDRVEHPNYIKEHNIRPDYEFYLTNQIMKPVGQIFALVVETLKGYKQDKDYYKRKYKSLLEKNNGDEKKTRNKIRDLKHKEACNIVFGDLLREAQNKKEGARKITDFFKPQ